MTGTPLEGGCLVCLLPPRAAAVKALSGTCLDCRCVRWYSRRLEAPSIDFVGLLWYFGRVILYERDLILSCARARGQARAGPGAPAQRASPSERGAEPARPKGAGAQQPSERRQAPEQTATARGSPHDATERPGASHAQSKAGPQRRPEPHL